MHYDTGVFRCIVIDFADFYLALFHSRQNRCYERGCGFAEREFGDDKRLVVDLFYFGTYLDRSSACAVIIF